MHLIEGPLRTNLLEIIQNSLPAEGVGLISETGEILVLPNHAYVPEATFEVHKDDIVDLVKRFPEFFTGEVTFWHSHPGGGIGPSRVDMQRKTIFPYHLVLSLVDGDLVPTWY